MASKRILPAVFALLFMLGGCNRRQQQFQTAAQITGGGNAEAGMTDLRKYGCAGCHTIPGIQGASGLVGPPLNQFAYRVYIAGRLPNTPENLMLWIQKPQQVVPNNAMPNMGVTEQDSRDIAAYLYTLR
jgi:cytochrome c